MGKYLHFWRKAGIGNDPRVRHGLDRAGMFWMTPLADDREWVQAGIRSRKHRRQYRRTKGEYVNSPTRMFSLRSDFPSEWYQLTNPTNAAADATVELTLSRNRFPYLFSSDQIKLTITSVDLYSVPDPSVQNPIFPDFLVVSVPGDPTPLDWPNSTTIGPLPGKSALTSVTVTTKEATAMWTLKVAAADAATLRDQTDDLLFVCRYKVG